MNNLQKYAGLLNDEAPKDHFLAYITPSERDMLVDAGGVKTPTPSGIFAYPPGYGGGYQGGGGRSSGGGSSSGKSSGGGGGRSSGPAGGASSGGNYGGNRQSGSNFGSGNNTPSPGGNRNNNNNNNSVGDQEDDVATMEKNMGVTTNNNPTGWSGDSGVDSFESSKDGLLGTPDYQGTVFTGGTFGTDKTQGSRTLSYGNDAATEDMGRPDITYYQPTGTTMGDYKSKTELNQIKYIQDSKLSSVKNKLKAAGYDISKDANFAETKAFINGLSSDEIADSYKDLKDKNGNPLYEAETIAKWEKIGYVPSGAASGKIGILGGLMDAMGKPLTKDELLSSLDEATAVGKSGGGKMDFQERMKTFQPNRYAQMTGMTYNPYSKTFTKNPNSGGGSEQDAFNRVAKPYEIGGTTPQESMVNKFFKNLGSNLGVSPTYMNTYNDAKNKIAKSLNLPPNPQQYGYNANPYSNYSMSMTSANPFYDELDNQGLI